MTNDQLEVLEELLDSLERRGLAVHRVKFGDVELEFSQEPQKAQSPPQIAPWAPLPRPQVEAKEPVPSIPDPYGASSLWPGGIRPSFPSPNKPEGSL